MGRSSGYVATGRPGPEAARRPRLPGSPWPPGPPQRSRRRLLGAGGSALGASALAAAITPAFATLVAALAGCGGPPPAAPSLPPPDPVSRAVLAPTGLLRIAVPVVAAGRATPSDVDGHAAPMRGLALDVCNALAVRLGVAAEVVDLPDEEGVLQALKAGRADISVLRADAQRARDVDFTPPMLAIELGVLARTDAPPTSVRTLDAPGLRLGVIEGGVAQRALFVLLRFTKLEPVATPQLAAERVRTGTLDAFAADKQTLFELTQRFPGTRVIDGRWGLVSLALAVPKGRNAAASELRRFASMMATSGAAADAARRAGLRGLAPSVASLATP